MLKKSTLRRVLLPLASVVAAFSVTASAQAWNLHEVKYGPASVMPSRWYQAPGGGSTQTTGNIAIYEGAGTVALCQATFDTFANVFREGCGNNAVGNALNLTPYYGHSLFPGIRNISPNTHTFRGVWYWGTP
jgi:hypothetical protein